MQLSFHSVTVVLTLVQTGQIRINIHQRNNKKKHSTTNTKHSKYKYIYYQRTHTLQNPHKHTPTHYKTHTNTLPHITKPTQTHSHTLQNPHKHTPTRYKTHTNTHPHITKPTQTHTHTLQNPHTHTHTHYKTHTNTHPHITKPTQTHSHTLQNPHKHTPTHYKTHTNTLPHITKHHPEDDRNSGRNVLMRKWWIKYFKNIAVRFVGHFYIVLLHYILRQFSTCSTYGSIWPLIYFTAHFNPVFCLCRYLLQVMYCEISNSLADDNSMHEKGMHVFVTNLLHSSA